MSKNEVEPERPQMTLWRRVACWISKVKSAQAHGSVRAPTPTDTRTHTHAHAHVELRKTFLFHHKNGFVNAPPY